MILKALERFEYFCNGGIIKLHHMYISGSDLLYRIDVDSKVTYDEESDTRKYQIIAYPEHGERVIGTVKQKVGDIVKMDMYSEYSSIINTLEKDITSARFKEEKRRILQSYLEQIDRIKIKCKENINEPYCSELLDYIDLIEQFLIEQDDEKPLASQITSHGTTTDTQSYKMSGSYDAEKLKDMMDRLKKHKLVNDKTDMYQTRNLFDNKVVKEPILWTGTKEELKYFIVQLYKQDKVVNDGIYKNKWSIAKNCFICENDPEWDLLKLRGQKPPTKESKKTIDSIVSYL